MAKSLGVVIVVARHQLFPRIAVVALMAVGAPEFLESIG